MGISGLLPTLKSIITPIHVREYAGLKVAIDTYSWLHKAAFSCSKDLCEGRPTDKIVQYCMHRVNLLRHHGVQPVLVFDGGVLPMKMDQEQIRARSRKENLQRAQEHERSGNHTAAFQCYQKAVDITPVIALSLIKVLQQEGVEYIVAPYEADAQMAYLALNDLVQVVITEDSDLIAYGCPRVLFKMDKSGHGEEFQYSDLVRNKDLNFTNFTKQMVLEMCIMSGCDYLPSLPGMGVKRAHGLMRRFKSYEKVIRHLRFSGITIPSDYEELFGRAILTFRHQRVYDPISEEMTLMKAIAVGKVDPCTKLPFQEDIEHTGVQRSTYKSFALQRNNKKSPELLVQKNVMTNYFFSPSKEAKKQFKAPRSAPEVEMGTGEKHYVETSTSEKEEFFRSLKADFSYPDLSTVFGSPLPDEDSDDEVGRDLGSTHQLYGESAILEHRNKADETLGASKDVPNLQALGLNLKIEDAPSISSLLACHVWAPGRDVDVPSTELKAVIGIRGQNDSLARVARNAEGAIECAPNQHKSGLPASAGERPSVKERTHIVAPQLKVSGYFSNKRMVQSSVVRRDTEEYATDRSEVSEEDADGCCEKVMKKSRIALCEIVRDKVEKSSLLSSSRCQDGSELAHARSESWNPISREEEQKQASPFSRFAHEGVSSKVEGFASNVAHVGHYARIAEKSMERRTTKGLEAVEATLNQFSYNLSSFKPPRLGQSRWPPKLVTSHDVRRQDPVCPDCP
ncbi:hypothetical protein AXG93_3884s1460 [Marchantia polymorpha subsp. ruderalis]|uniref:Exonuclease 1 n=1 Tax=Marchantia polymorpha subsp. ruderalis TaxID=1480154 RepID=A0A176W9G0_MARPO|nr:hypothetical protein AXG93_3884s1460 [Marchantia polymorpha subsp. ruderalis]